MNPVIDKIKKWFNEKGQLHRTVGPAIEYADGSYFWYLNGVRHRTDGPAVEYADGSKVWYLNGKRHRTDGPAKEWANGSKSWYLNGVLHRTDGPAYEGSDGYRFWWLNGHLHRTDGPAIETDRYKYWYLNGTELSEDLHRKLTIGPVKKLPLYLGMGFDKFISKRLQHESNRIYFRTHRYKSRGCRNSLGGLKYGEKCKRSLG
jgi:hypothetical protein